MAKAQKKKTASKPAEKPVVDLIRKIGLLGVGIASLTREKAEKITKDLVKKGNITEAEGRKLTQDLIKKSMVATKNMETKINKELKKTIKSAKFATAEEVRRLEKKLAELEKRLDGKTPENKKTAA